MVNQSIQTYICEIRKTLKTFAAHPVTRKNLLETKYWTDNVKRRIGCIGKGKDFEVYSTLHRYKYDKKWQRVDKKVEGDKGE